MEIITISGYLHEDCEKRKDKQGRDYIRFKVDVEGTTSYGKSRMTQYRCFTYNMQYDNMKKNDFITVSGSFNINIINNKYNFDIYAHCIAKGRI